VASAAELAGYKLVIAPALIIVPETLTRALVDYVKGGGVLVLTARCGMKDEHNALLPLRQPGLLTEAAGVEVEEYYALGEDIPVNGPGLEGRARLWAERLLPVGANPAEVIAGYGRDAGWLAGKPAVTRSSYGKGRVYYVGAWLDHAAQDALLGRITEEAGAAVFPAPAGVEVRCRRAPDGRAVWFVINHTNENATLDLPGAWHDYLSQRDVPRPCILAPYGVMICRRT
jgi:beta-galactosidase